MLGWASCPLPTFKCTPNVRPAPAVCFAQPARRQLSSKARQQKVKKEYDDSGDDEEWKPRTKRRSRGKRQAAA